MIEMKYVVVETESAGKELFVFPTTIDHDKFVEVLSYIKTGGRNWSREFRRPISAGFTDMKTCYGKSESLKLKSDPEDTKILQLGGKSK